jgi:hypothetical protein
MMTALAGCGTLDQTPAGGSAADLLAFYRYAGALDRAAWQHEYRSFRNWVRDDHCGPDRIRLAMLIMQGDGATEAQAEPVLAPCLQGDHRPPPALRQWAYLLDDQLGRRQELSERIRNLQARRDQLRSELREARGERDDLQTELAELRRQVASLKEQLEALKDIERSIRQRD